MKREDNNQPLEEFGRPIGRANGRVRDDIIHTEIDSLEFASEESFVLNRETSETLVIYCADPRFRLAFQEFIGKELGIGHHTLLSLAGGVGPFVLFKPESVQAVQMVDQLRLFISNSGIKQVLVLSHSDCKWYAKLMPDRDSKKVADRQIADLQHFARMVRFEIAEVPVHTYLAVLEKENVRFRKVPPG